ncbi:hypothetical protein SADUNF_Sadunf10G0043600 [Salix dunnii]|uniref:Uncharacterized protein n=1 Tax=Salix dunnii TaxID=1413687 RepID=A0A835MQ47_9ROSI|nr:hypothetical protein SADUNF_Sadunf10G0043600 [Salix dunnii]
MQSIILKIKRLVIFDALRFSIQAYTIRTFIYKLQNKTLCNLTQGIQTRLHPRDSGNYGVKMPNQTILSPTEHPMDEIPDYMGILIARTTNPVCSLKFDITFANNTLLESRPPRLQLFMDSTQVLPVQFCPFDIRTTNGKFPCANSSAFGMPRRKQIIYKERHYQKEKEG